MCILWPELFLGINIFFRIMFRIKKNTINADGRHCGTRSDVESYACTWFDLPIIVNLDFRSEKPVSRVPVIPHTDTDSPHMKTFRVKTPKSGNKYDDKLKQMYVSPSSTLSFFHAICTSLYLLYNNNEHRSL